MLRKLEITSGAYDKPLVTTGIYDDSPAALLIKWKQLHEGDKEFSFYEIRMDKESGIATVKRTGEYSSELIFDTSKNTVGVVNTPYGAINTRIRTKYITLPSVIAPRFEISYEMGEDDIKNIFSVKPL